jgi:hypothetical protein
MGVKYKFDKNNTQNQYFFTGYEMILYFYQNYN